MIRRRGRRVASSVGPFTGMLPPFPKQTLIPYAETLLIAAAGGVTFTLIGVPAGLVSGSMLVTAAAALMGRPTKVPLSLARVCFVLIGILLGAVVTPATLRGMATWPMSIVVLSASTAVVTRRRTATARWRRAPGWSALARGPPRGSSPTKRLTSGR